MAQPTPPWIAERRRRLRLVRDYTLGVLLALPVVVAVVVTTNRVWQQHKAAEANRLAALQTAWEQEEARLRAEQERPDPGLQAFRRALAAQKALVTLERDPRASRRALAEARAEARASLEQLRQIK